MPRRHPSTPVTGASNAPPQRGPSRPRAVRVEQSHCAWERGHRALGDATHTRRPRAVQVHAGETPARRSGSWVRAPPARISAAPAPGARAFGAHISSACPGCAPPARISAAPAPGARAFGAHISSACPGCARLRRAYQQRLPRVRAPPARISAAPAPGARASGAHGSSEDWRFRTVSQAPKG